MISLILYVISLLFAVITSLSEEGKLPKGWNKKDTWGNKYKFTEDDTLIGRKFLFSDTLLVWTTDLFHFSQMVSFTLVQVSISLLVVDMHKLPYWYILVFVLGFKIIQGLIQEVLRWMMKKRKN